ncbi:phosphate ABC transporter permease subunit PstC [Sulfoacidibacillus thermotolerans]|uniref:Phosphate transport system permease protein n=1 Tax=Sulfoacidibacillus thermotolerans TaxID=1765684 RepID=A0A2U3D9F6_SULT2|nr:phosphate ABC transporter permease subunit PstC [Sulfoacidibacillus thermotolerans]PWI57920.1 phosphate ABC transporter permease subunit PstC [Sulfoacidibacillus thermotolerans]
MGKQRIHLGELLFLTCIIGSGAVIILMMGLVVMQLLVHAWPAIWRFGPAVLWTAKWQPEHQIFGLWPFIFATVSSSAIGVFLASVIGTATAIIISRIRIRWLRIFSSGLVQWLALIPSVVFGLWGIKFVAPMLSLLIGMQNITKRSMLVDVEGLFLTGLTLAAMLLPTIVAVTRETLIAVPQSLIEGALALGATVNEATIKVVLPYARRGIFGAVFLALGRALGETVAVVMVIGSQPKLAVTLFTKTDTLTSLLATKWNHMSGFYSQSILFEAGFLLFILTFIFYAVARIYVPRSITAARLQLW